jgi:acetyl esterase/lipase
MTACAGRCHQLAHRRWTAIGAGRFRWLLKLSLLLPVLLIAGCARAMSLDPDRLARMPGAPGTVLWRQPILGAPDGAAAYRVLYRSTGLDGHGISVSGLVVIPVGLAPPGGRPIVAWAHPTTGVVPRCAPSEAMFRFQQIQGLRDMVQHGYIVTATDYPGLGTEGPHPYLVGGSEARAVLDSVRAARTLAGAEAGRRFAVWGHSQGGQAALFTGILAAHYAPELQLVGVAAAAPATELSTLLQADLGTPAGKNLTAMTLWSWNRVYGAPIDTVVIPAALPVIDRLAGECIESIYDLYIRGRAERPLENSFLTVDNLVATEPWASLAAHNTPGTLPAEIPVFISQGTGDAIVPTRITRNYVQQLCAAGSRVTLIEMPGVGHGFAAMRSARDAVAWMADRFDGRPPPNDCS